MKKKDFDDLKTKSIHDLGRKIRELEKEKISALLELRMGKTKNVHVVKQIKRDIAKTKTIFNAKLFIQKSSSHFNKMEVRKEKNAT